MRKDFLKGYIVALIAEGKFKAGDPINTILSKVWLSVKEDFPSVAKELATAVAEQTVKHIGDRVGESVRARMQDMIHTLSKQGFGAIWSDLQTAYTAGTNAKRSK